MECGCIANGGEAVPFGPFGHAHMHLPIGHLRLGHQPAVVVFVPRNRRAPAFDRIGQKANRAVVIDGGKGLGHGVDAIAAKVFHQGRQFRIAARVQKGGDVALVAQVIHQVFAPYASTHIGQRGVKLVGTVIDPVLQLLPAGFGKGGALQLAVFDAHDVPAKGVEHFFGPLEQAFLDDPV